MIEMVMPADSVTADFELIVRLTSKVVFAMEPGKVYSS